MTQKNALAEKPTEKSVEYTLQYQPNSVAELSVVVSIPVALSARKEAIRIVGKGKSLPGFRKGKASDEMVVHNFPTDVDKAWQEQLANFALRECLKTAPVAPLNNETKIVFTIEKHSITEESKLSLKFEVEPKIPEIDTEGFSLKPVKRPAVDQDKIDETVRQTLFFFAEWETISDRAADKGDCVVLDVDIIETTPHKPLFTATRFEVTSKNMADWMLQLVVGMKIGEAREGLSIADETASVEEKELFKPKKVLLSLRSIQKAILPELTDEFVKQLGVATVAELKENITSILNRQADDHVKEQEREQISTFLVEKFPFDLPLSMVDREARFRMRQLFQDQNFQSYWQTLSHEEQKKSVDTLFEQSKKAIRMFYLCRKILLDNKLNVSPQELNKPPVTPVEVLLNPTGAPHGKSTDVENAEAFSRLVLEKAEDFLLAKIKSAK